MSLNFKHFISYFFGLNFGQLFLKILNGMANSVDPDQTVEAVFSESALFAHAISLGNLVYDMPVNVSICLSFSFFTFTLDIIC